MPAIAGTKYMSATDVGVAVGAMAAGGGDTTIAEVSADEPQQELSGLKVAIIVYVPGMFGGIHV